ncbi:MAG TPA: hypothetical protein VFH99_03550 [Candidatus Saccharimonadales bacterium]|nr:hypothetical protein [Candidatus Saccharimonadales bacterium]
MIKKIKSFILVIATTLAFATPAILPLGTSYAFNCNGVPDTVANGAQDASGGDIGCDPSGGLNSGTGNNIGDLANTIVNIFSIIVGAAAIIMIIYAGFRYITSGGSSERIGSAKTTLIYAIIGLVVVALAQILVHFVLSASINAGNSVAS